MATHPRSKTLMAVLAAVAVVTFGTLGYRLIEGWPWFECLYMTLITIATIGYREPEGITLHGRYFTAILIVCGVWTFGYAVTMLAQAAVQGELLAEFGKRRLQERFNKLSNHLVICGCGRVGQAVARGLASEKINFVVIEAERDKAELLSESGWLVLHGDARQEEVLLQAGIERARGLVCALPTDADNVFIVLTARDLVSGPLYIVARVNDETTIPKMRKAGADKIISPIGTGARQILQSLLRPKVAQFIEFATMKEGLDLVIEEVVINESAPIVGKTLKEADLRRSLEIIVVAIIPSDGEMVFNPTADTKVNVGDTLIVIGNHAGIAGLEKLAIASHTSAV